MPSDTFAAGIEAAARVAEAALNRCYQRSNGRGINDAKATLNDILSLAPTATSMPDATVTKVDEDAAKSLARYLIGSTSHEEAARAFARHRIAALTQQEKTDAE